MFIPDQIIVEILKRLPAKSLLRCMSVSKSWHSLIKSHSFISYHFNHHISQEPKYLILTYRNGCTYDYYVHSDNENFDMILKFNTNLCECVFVGRAVACCNGIYCFMSHSYPRVDNDIIFRLWNISLRKILYLKVPYCTRGNDDNSACWFGFDEVSEDYKLLWVGHSKTASREIRPFSVYIYSLNERAWRCVNSSFSLNEGWVGFKGLYLNGVIHWVFVRSYPYNNNKIRRYMPEVILTFSLAHETFGVCNLPSEIVYLEPSHDYTGPDDAVDLMTVKRGGKNCLVVVHRDKITLNYWVMEEEGRQESWVKDFSIINENRDTRVLSARMTGEIVMDSTSRGVVSFDPRRMRMNPLSSVKTPRYLNCAGNYMESLVLLL